MPTPADPASAEALLGSLELAVLRSLWQGSPATVRTVLERVNEARVDGLAYTSVMTVLDRLHGKGLVTRERSGRAYEYHAVLADEPALVHHLGQREVARLVERLGSVALVHFAAALDELEPGTREGLESLARRAD